MDVSVFFVFFFWLFVFLLLFVVFVCVVFSPDQWEIIVVDDGSTDRSREVVTDWGRNSPIAVCLLEQSNSGPAAARNRGGEIARGEYLIFIDNDILVEPDFLRAHLGTLRSQPGCWVVGRVIQTPRLRETSFGRFRDSLHERFHQSFAEDVPTETTWVTTQNLSLPSADFRRLGGFDEGFTIASSEDWELGLRARKLGVRLLYDPRIAILHNDWAGTLDSFCERQRLYSLSDVLLWRKYGSECPRQEMIAQNGPIRWTGDRPTIIAKKLFKGALRTSPCWQLWRLCCRAAERVAPDSRLCHSLYHLGIGASIQRGVRQGLLQYAEAPRTALPNATEESGVPGAARDNRSMPFVSVIVPTYNRRSVLLRTLGAVARTTYPRDWWELIVIDDGGSDGSEETVRRWAKDAAVSLRYVRQENSGPGAARNRGASMARGEFLVLLDNDIVVAPEFLRLHVEALQANPGCWIAGRITHREALRATPFGRYRDFVWEQFHRKAPPAQISETLLGSAANMSLPAADFQRLNGFDESFTIASSEDWDLGIRARAAGIRVLYHPGIVGFHDDWAINLEHFCERQRLYSQSDVLLWQKYGEASPRIRVVRENGPHDWHRDHAGLLAKKTVKQLLATAAGRGVVRGLCGAAERLVPDSRISRRLYEICVALAIFRGVREGLAADHSPDFTTPGAVASGV